MLNKIIKIDNEMEKISEIMDEHRCYKCEKKVFLGICYECKKDVCIRDSIQIPLLFGYSHIICYDCLDHPKLKELRECQLKFEKHIRNDTLYKCERGERYKIFKKIYRSGNK